MIVTLKYSPGDKVTIINGEIEAVVNRVIIERGAVRYECEWWNEKNCHCMEFYDQELSAEKINTLQVVRTE